MGRETLCLQCLRPKKEKLWYSWCLRSPQRSSHDPQDDRSLENLGDEVKACIQSGLVPQLEQQQHHDEHHEGRSP